MDLDYYNSLREANVARNLEWTGGVKPGAAFRGTELAGEAGEVLSLFFAPSETLGAYRLPKAHEFVEELADVAICCDLTAMDFGLGYLNPRVPDFDPMDLSRSDRELAAMIALHAGLAANLLKKVEREERGWKGSRAKRPEIERHVRACWAFVQLLGSRIAGDSFNDGIAEKFNKTSANVGLLTRYVAPVGA
jgi:hypothetical protein